jgi:hypothetical protein
MTITDESRPTNAPAAKRPIDKEALLAKYVAERDKRIRADGNA